VWANAPNQQRLPYWLESREKTATNSCN
jgi:hypothetical protein